MVNSATIVHEAAAGTGNAHRTGAVYQYTNQMVGREAWHSYEAVVHLGVNTKTNKRILKMAGTLEECMDYVTRWMG